MLRKEKTDEGCRKQNKSSSMDLIRKLHLILPSGQGTYFNCRKNTAAHSVFMGFIKFWA
jgi:hypothetical protein